MDDRRQGYRACRDARLNLAGLSRVPTVAQPQIQGQNAGAPVPGVHEGPDPGFREGRHQGEDHLRGVGRAQRTHQVPHSLILHGHQAAQGRQVPDSHQETMELHHLRIRRSRRIQLCRSQT